MFWFASPPLKNDERNYSCLDKCMEALPAADRDLVSSYYQLDKGAKIHHRKQLAERLGLERNALRIRACRIRAKLQNCMRRCAADEA